MAENGLFKTVMRGFRKEDVLQYIDELMTEKTQVTEQFEAKIAALQAELADANVKKEAVAENERLTGEVARLQQEAVAAQAKLGELQAKLAEAQGASDAARERDAELTAQLEESHQAISALWEEKAALWEQLEQSKQAALQLREVGEEFCRRVMDLIPEPPAEEPTVEEEQAPAIITEEPLVITEEPRAAEKPMERWLF